MGAAFATSAEAGADEAAGDPAGDPAGDEDASTSGGGVVAVGWVTGVSRVSAWGPEQESAEKTVTRANDLRAFIAAHRSTALRLTGLNAPTFAAVARRTGGLTEILN